MKIRAIFFLAMIVTVAAAAQEAPVVSEPDTVQGQQIEQKQVTKEVTESTPESFDPTEEVSEDYSIEFPVDI